MLMQQELVPCVRCGNHAKFSRGIHNTGPAGRIPNPMEPVASGQHPWASEAESESSGHPVSILQRRGRGSEREEPAQSHEAGEGWECSLNPGLLASEAQLSLYPPAPGIRHLFFYSLLA